MMGGLRHLSSRFFQVLRAKALSPREQTEVEALLQPSERNLFWGQQPTDQRHGLKAAKGVLVAAPGRRDLARACLLHDVGKSHARLGVVGRTLATISALLHLPSTARMRAYLDHGVVGAEALSKAGAEELVVAFARFHHGSAPDGADGDDWALMAGADK